MITRNITGQFTGNKYKKINGKWFRKKCDKCSCWVQRIDQKYCKVCVTRKKPKNFVHNRPHSEETKRLISEKKQKDNLTYSGIHTWLYTNFDKQKRCENLDCIGNSSHYDWACITGKYEKDISNFRTLCRSCHKLYDTGKIKLRLKGSL